MGAFGARSLSGMHEFHVAQHGIGAFLKVTSLRPEGAFCGRREHAFSVCFLAQVGRQRHLEPVFTCRIVCAMRKCARRQGFGQEYKTARAAVWESLREHPACLITTQKPARFRVVWSAGGGMRACSRGQNGAAVEHLDRRRQHGLERAAGSLLIRCRGRAKKRNPLRRAKALLSNG